MVIQIKKIILENEENKNPSFFKNAKIALKHPKYQKLLATNMVSSALGGIIGSVGGVALLKAVKPLTEDAVNPTVEPIQNNILKSKISQDLNFIKGIGAGVYKIGRGALLYPYKGAKFISRHTPDAVGSTARIGGLGYLSYEGYNALKNLEQ